MFLFLGVTTMIKNEKKNQNNTQPIMIKTGQLIALRYVSYCPSDEKLQSIPSLGAESHPPS